MTLKIIKCTQCNNEYNHFSFKAYHLSRNIHICKECYKKLKVEKIKEYNKKHKTKRSEYNKKYRKKPFVKYKKYKNSANKRNIEFNLSFEDFMTFWEKPCFYCNDPIETIGIDRIDNNKGYFLENCASCCTVCNRMKLSSPVKDFLEQVHKIANNCSK